MSGDGSGDGGGTQGRGYRRGARVAGTQALASVILSGVALQGVARRLGGKFGSQLEAAAGRAIDDWEGDWCGIPPGGGPHPHPRAVLGLAADLVGFARSLPEESELRKDVLAAAHHISERVFESRIFESS